MKRTAFTLIALSLLILPTRAWADSDFGTPSEPDRAQWFQYAALGVGFAYDPVRWARATADETTTRHVVDWRGRESRDLIAKCYLQTYERPEWTQLPEELIHTHLEPIARGMMANGDEPDPNISLVSRKAIYADDYPVIQLERRKTGESLDFDTGMTVVGVFTVWRRHAVLLECGYPDTIREDESAHDFVRDEIQQILRSMRFER